MILRLLLFLLLLQLSFSCKKDENSTSIELEDSTPSLNITYSQAPIVLDRSDVKFAKDIQYGEFSRNQLDIFLPTSSSKTPLVIYIHGGGFTKGDKTQAYGGASYINSLLDKDIAFASLNYRFLEDNESIGLRKPIFDVMYALQFIRYYSQSFNIDSDLIILKGTSAGAGTSLWIALGDDHKDVGASDPIKRQSTKVAGVVASETQGTYDLMAWESIFSIYSLDTTSSLESKIMSFYGIDDVNKVSSTAVIAYREEFDFLNFMDQSDPELWVENKSIDYSYPNTSSDLLHHPLHAKTLKDQADRVGLKSQFYIPKMSIMDSLSESELEFVYRIFKKN